MAKRAAGGMKEAGVGAGGRARAPRCVAARTSHISSWEGCARRSRFVYRFFGSGLRVYTYFLDGVAAPLFAGAPRLAPARPPPTAALSLSACSSSRGSIWLRTFDDAMTTVSAQESSADVQPPPRDLPERCTVVVCYFSLGLAANPLRGDARADSGAAVRAPRSGTVASLVGARITSGRSFFW